MTYEELLEEAAAWGSGRKSWTNDLHDYGRDDPAGFAAKMAVADAATAHGFYIAAQAQKALDQHQPRERRLRT